MKNASSVKNDKELRDVLTSTGLNEEMITTLVDVKFHIDVDRIITDAENMRRHVLLFDEKWLSNLPILKLRFK